MSETSRLKAKALKANEQKGKDQKKGETQKFSAREVARDLA